MKVNDKNRKSNIFEKFKYNEYGTINLIRKSILTTFAKDVSNNFDDIKKK